MGAVAGRRFCRAWSRIVREVWVSDFACVGGKARGSKVFFRILLCKLGRVTKDDYTCGRRNLTEGIVAIRLRPRGFGAVRGWTRMWVVLGRTAHVAPGRSEQVAHWQGRRDYESHRVPFGAMILDAKYCEWCGGNFLREAQSTTRYCSQCSLTIPSLNVPCSHKLASQLIH